MDNLDVIVAIVFSLVVFITGISFARHVGNSKSFFAAGGAVPWWISGISLFMSFFSVGTFVVWGAIAYNDGMVAIAIQATMCIAGLFIGFFIAPKWRRTNALTAAEFIGKRFGEGLRKTYSILFLMISIFTSGFFLYPVGRMIEITTGIPLEVSIISLGVLILIYTAVGGLWAVLVTDVLQFVVLSAAVIIVVPLAFAQVGGVSEFISRAPDNFFALYNDQYTWGFLIAFLVYNTVYIGGNWAYVQRYTSVATPKDAKKVGWLFGALYTISPLIWMLPPMIYRVMQPDLQGLESEGAYLQISMEVIPTGLLGLVLGSMVFATASSVNTTLNISSGVFTNDIYRSLKGDISEKETMFVARMMTMVFGVLTIFIALMVQKMGGIVEVVISIGAITGGAMFMPPIWALFSRRQTAVSMILATVISLSVNLFFKFIAPTMINVSLSRTEEMVLGVFGTVAVLTMSEIYYGLRGKENLSIQAEKPFNEISQTTHQDAAVDSEANQRGKKIISFGILAIGALIVSLGINAGEETILVVTIGLIISSISAIGLYSVRKI
jgi:solute:Na+ symporter, SSS family